MEENNNSGQSSSQNAPQPSEPSSRPATPQRETSTYQERSGNEGGLIRKG